MRFAKRPSSEQGRPRAAPLQTNSNEVWLLYLHCWNIDISLIWFR